MINIDLVEDHFEGVAYVIPSTKKLPASVAYFSTPNASGEQVAQAHVVPVDPLTGFPRDWESIKTLYGDDVVHSPRAEVSLKVLDGQLHVDATTNIGVNFAAVLQKPTGNAVSKIVGKRMCWDGFKKHVSSLAQSSILFRGQSKDWSLCTSFHRRGRYQTLSETAHNRTLCELNPPLNLYDAFLRGTQEQTQDPEGHDQPAPLGIRGPAGRFHRRLARGGGFRPG